MYKNFFTIRILKVLLSAGVCFALFPVAMSLAEEHASLEKKVQEIRIQGNKTVNSDAILGFMTTRVGDVFNKSKIAKDVKGIFESHYFQDVQIEIQETDASHCVLIVKVYEKPTINSINFKGFVAVSESTYEEKITAKPYTILDEQKLSVDLRTLEQLYIEKGFYLAKTSYQIIPVQEGVVDILFSVNENSPVTVSKINFIGNKYFSDHELGLGLATRPYNWMSFVMSSGVFKDEFVTRDTQFLQYYLQDNGFAEARVSLANSMLDVGRQNVTVNFYMEEGERFHIGEIKISGDIVTSEQEILEKLAAKQGALFRISDMYKDVKTLQEIYGNEGYAFADINPTQLTNRKEKFINIEYKITKGKRAYFHKIEIEGNIKTRDNVIRRNLKIAEGELFHAKNLEDSKESIERLGFFENVSLIREDDPEHDSVNVRVKIKEKSTGNLSASLGASPAQNQTRGATIYGTGNYQEQNLIGRAYGIGLSIQVSPAPENQGMNWSVGFNFANPSIDDGPWNFSVDTSFSRTIEYSYYAPFKEQTHAFTTNQALRGGFAVGREVLPDLRLSLGYSAARIVSMPVVNLTKKFFSSGDTESFNQVIVYNKTDNYIAPTSGLFIRGTSSIYGDYTFGQYKFGKLIGNFSYYYPVIFTGDYKTNFKFTFQPGYVYPMEGNSVPLWERFRLGDSYRMRGYSQYPESLIAPKTPVLISPSTGEFVEMVTGGNRSLYAALEYFLPIIPDAGLKAVTFFEAGTVLDDYDHFSGKSVKYDLGFGFRWLTPIAPFRFEWAWPLENGRLGKQNFVFTIGHDLQGAN